MSTQRRTRSASEVGRHGGESVLSLPRRPASVFVAVAVAATVAGLFAAWLVAPVDVSVLSIPLAGWAFLLVWTVATGVLLSERVPSGVIANGSYLAAGMVLIWPFRAIGPRLDAGSVGAFRDVLLWGLVAIALAGALFVAGRRLRRRARRRAARRSRKRKYAELS